MNVYLCDCSYEIEKLEKEQEEMKLDLAVSESGSRRQQDTESALNLHSMLDQKEQVDDKLEREKQFQADLAKEVDCTFVSAQTR